MDWIVIGSGIGGLTCAAVLSQFGYKICVLEAHEVAGGSTHEYKIGRYKFPSGLHYVIPHCQQVLQISTGEATPSVYFDRIGNRKGYYEKILLLNGESVQIRNEQQFLSALRTKFPNNSSLEAYEKLATRLLTISPLWMALHVLPWKYREKLMKWIIPQVWWDHAGRTAASVLEEIDDPSLQTYLGALWVDTGCPPHRASFFLSAAVALGFPHEGGVYPRGGPTSIAAVLVQRIRDAGGLVLCRAPVNEICVHENRATGVKVGNQEIFAKCGVISACGWRNTARLTRVKDDIDDGDTCLPPQGDGFVMANVGFRGGENLECMNLWPQPGGPDQSLLKGIEKYLDNPLGVTPREIPLMITFPSLKDRSFHDSEHQTAQILALAPTDWFGSLPDQPSPAWRPPARDDDYLELKNAWRDRLRTAFTTYFPHLEIELFDVSTPHTIEHYLPTQSGSAIGLDVTPNRFVNMRTMKKLDMKTSVQGLWRTGQDTLLIGVPLAQAAGLMTALRILGPLRSLQFIFRSIWILAYQGKH